jgi:hypothetical protein
MVVAGLGLIVADFRFNGFDFIPDVVGWGFLLGGLVKLRGRSPWFTAAAVAAAFGVLVGIPQQFGEASPALSAVEGLVLGVFVFSTLTGIRAVVGSERTRNTANLLRWSDLTVSVLGALGPVLGGPTEVSGLGVPLLVLAVLAALGLVVWLLVFLWSIRHDPGLGAPGSMSLPDPVH